jgi:5-methylcytosine-specific restriction endonuclease McrA
MKRKSWIAKNYLKLINYKCAYPGCPFAAVEIHHIIPISKGGLDEIRNMVSLCWMHHRQNINHIHKDYEKHEISLATMKHMLEFQEVGHIIDKTSTDENTIIED